MFSSNQSSSSSSVLPAYLAYTSLAFCSLVLAVGVLGNLLVLLVIITSKSMRYDMLYNNSSCNGLIKGYTTSCNSLIEKIGYAAPFYSLI
jgi:hypothetical protein